MEQVERPQADSRKIHSKNEFELCYIRHQYFRKVKYNPTEQEMLPYRSVIKNLSHRTYYTYLRLFHIVGMTFDDVFAIGNIHLVNFIGLFEISQDKTPERYETFANARKKKFFVEVTPVELLSKNKANLTCFIKQRMEDLVRICKQKAKNIKGIRVDEYIAFFGANPPPDDVHQLIDGGKALGFHRLDNVTFKAVKKKAKGRIGVPFKWASSWYVTVPVSQISLTWDDLANAGFDPYENEHNLNPEQLLLRGQEENRIDKKIKMFKNGSNEDKARTIASFIEKNADNPSYKEEILIARKTLRTLGTLDVV